MSGTKKTVQEDEFVDCECYGSSRTKKSCPAVRVVTHPLRYYEFTQEEMKALEECDNESFYGRCLPFSAILAGITYKAIKSDVIRGSQHFGVVPKVMAAMFVGYVIGRISYINEYDRRLRDLPPDSKLGNLMRKYHEENNPKPPAPKK